MLCLGVNISEDLTWTTHIQTQVKKARQRLYHLRQLRKFRVSPSILKTFYSGTIESVLTQCISVWYGNSSSQDCKALQRVVRLAEHISGSALPSLQDIYLKRCRSRAVKIKDSNHPGNCLFTLLLLRGWRDVRQADPFAKLYYNTWSYSGRVSKQQTGMAGAKHRAIRRASVCRRSANNIQQGLGREIIQVHKQ